MRGGMSQLKNNHIPESRGFNRFPSFSDLMESYEAYLVLILGVRIRRFKRWQVLTQYVSIDYPHEAKAISPRSVSPAILIRYSNVLVDVAHLNNAL